MRTSYLFASALRFSFLFAALFVGLFVVGAAGCNNATSAICDNATCPTNTHCDPNGACVPNVSLDFGAGGGDMAVSCSPACSGATPFCDKTHHCVACIADTDCPVGTVCHIGGLGASCVPGCTDDARCGKKDGGAGQSCCQMACVDTQTDANNCGACGMVCGAQHARPTCAAGKCMTGMCDAGWADCNGDPKDGCETNLHVDPMNCTKCGMKCALPNAVQGCSDACYIKSCNFGFDDCDQDMTNGCETSVLSDIKNCGACGKPCTNLPHAKSSCASATCLLSSCDQGFSDCDGNPQNGCEATTGTDVKNCGKCGNVCAQGLVCVNGGCTCNNCTLPNAKTACINNVCMFDSCLPGFADCNNNTADGCEVNVNNDKNNCGGCGKVCPMNMPGCNMGNCSTGCLNGQQPPSVCTNGKDPETGDAYTICQADCNGAWLSATQQGGGHYHIQQICKSYGYSNYQMYGGTCGTVCGYCGQGSCMANGTPKYDSGGMGCGNDQFGPILCLTVHWTCIK